MPPSAAWRNNRITFYYVKVLSGREMDCFLDDRNFDL